MDKNFENLIRYFPLVQLPFTLEKGSEHDFGMTNDILPTALFEELISPHLSFEVDEFTEMLPGYHWRSDQDGYLLVFWVARLLKYSFIVFSYTKDGVWIDDAEIAGLLCENDEVCYRIANIAERNSIYIVEAGVTDDDQPINPQNTSKWVLELRPDGQFVQTSAEEIE
jgi:hypothetical protein